MLGCVMIGCAASLVGQSKRLWVLRESGEMVEYDPATFAAKQTVKIPADSVQSPQNVAVNAQGQILYAPVVSLPLVDTDIASPHKAWLWNGKAAAAIDLGVKHETSTTGSNQVVTESAPTVFLSADGNHLFWFANEQRRLQREDVDLSVTTTWQAWRTDLNGANREDLTSTKLPDCRCTTGSCEETCANGVVWIPDDGVGNFFVMTQFVSGKDAPAYKSSASYHEDNGKWTSIATADPLHRVLDATPTGDFIVEAIPDTGCCGWSNQSNDQTLVHANGKTLTLFDERSTYKNPDYDVSFFTSNAHLSQAQAYLAMTIAATAKLNQAIQLAQDGQANPEESKQIRKALADLPAVEIKTLDDTPRQIAFLPHATLVGWISDKEILIVEDHLLVAFNVATGSRKKSTVHVEDAAHVFLR
jgi:hypothetical protein